MNRVLVIVLAALGLMGPALAGPSPRAVVELFTSQGCSSCPPADARLAELARRPDVIALTLPVDYWDYLGWKDTLAKPEFTARQRAYAHRRGDRAVFTPQMVVNGAVSCVGSDDAAIGRAMERATADGPVLPVSVRATREGESVRIEIEGAGETPSGVWLLPILRSREVTIGRGENRGRSATYVNVVRAMLRIGEWSGGPMSLTAPLPPGEEADGYVVLVQAVRGTKPAQIVGAAKVGDF